MIDKIIDIWVYLLCPYDYPLGLPLSLYLHCNEGKGDYSHAVLLSLGKIFGRCQDNVMCCKYRYVCRYSKIQLFNNIHLLYVHYCHYLLMIAHECYIIDSKLRNGIVIKRKLRQRALCVPFVSKNINPEIVFQRKCSLENLKTFFFQTVMHNKRPMDHIAYLRNQFKSI